MKKTLIATILVALVLITHRSTFAQDGFKPLFNGNDLTAWDGNPELWSVADGCIVGKTSGPEQLAYNQFLIWRGGVVKNFELRAMIKQDGNNTGIQYRSRELPEVGKWSVGGYQCDIHPTPANNAMVYGEKAGGILAQNGQNMIIDPDGMQWLVAKHEPVAVDVTQWHEYRIIAQGNHIVHKIDGMTTIELRDFDEKTRSREGLLGFQIHRGPAMTVQIKDVMLKELPDGEFAAYDKAALPEGTLPLDKPKPKVKGTPQPKAKPRQNEQQKGAGKAKNDQQSKAEVPAIETASPQKSASTTVPVEGMKWLWSDSKSPGSGARLKTVFQVSDTEISEAALQVTCDNGAKVFLNGELVVNNADWQKPSLADVKQQLKIGSNELLVEATNKGGVAAFIASLILRFTDGREQFVLTDESWLAMEPNSNEWKSAKVIANYGVRPWGDVFAISSVAKPKGSSVEEPSTEATQVADIRTLPGFKVELIHTVSKTEEGSWVGLTVDDRGRLITCDQYGGLYRMTPPPIGSNEVAKVEKLAANIAGAHGLLYAFDSLYVMVNQEPEVAGLWRLRDTKGTGQFDEKTLLRAINGRGEHGNHSITLSPDGSSLYIACGNSTVQPDPLEHTRLSRPFGDDQVLPRIQRGAAFSDTEPQAFTCKVSPDGKRFEMVAAGLRNHFDVAFNALGDLFTYDSDMEWDVGTPWYRPTRMYHLVSGGDYGFRESSGKLLEYCPDILPPLINVGPGSPTGMVSGQGAAFPANYQHAIYACDWTYGTLYAVHLTPDGAGYNAKLEEFVFGKPLPLTDVVIGKDGAMYFSIGGRRTQSAVYRLTYVGKENTAPAAKPTETFEHKLRVSLERLHDQGTGPDAIDKAWKYLGHSDRLVRWAARVAIERQPVELWADRVDRAAQVDRADQTKRSPLADQISVPWSFLESAVALARMGGKERQHVVLKQLNGLEFGALSIPQQLALVRAYQISISRNGVPEGDYLRQSLAQLDAVYPAMTNDLNRELSRTLVALGSTSIVAKTLQLMDTAKDDEVSWLSADIVARNDRYGPNFLRSGSSRPNVQQIAYAYALRMAKVGWTPERRQTFFKWVASTAPWQGGNQFRGFLDQIRADALATVTDLAEQKALSELAGPVLSAKSNKNIKPPKGPGKNYTVDEVVAFTKDNLHNRDFKHGRDMFLAASCQACHRLGNDGGGVGPDLTLSANRYTLRDLMENIIDPSKVISEQYGSTLLILADGTIISGRITSEDETSLFIAANPNAPNEITEVKVADIESRKASPTSLMPVGLVNAMNPSELMDLTAYILSAGDRKHRMFRP